MNDFSIWVAIFMEAFVSIHMSLFVLNPLANIISKENSKKTFWILFSIRAAILLFFDFFVTTSIAIVDFFSVFIGAFILIPVGMGVSALKNKWNSITNTNSSNPLSNNIKMDQPKTNNELSLLPTKVAVSPNNFDALYKLSEDQMLEEVINKELSKAEIDDFTNLIPSNILQRKKVLFIILSILIFVYISLIFFHFPSYVYIVWAVVLLIYWIISSKLSKFSFVEYLKKEIKVNSREKISNVIKYSKSNLNFIQNNIKTYIYIIVAVVLPLVIFSVPRIIYEKNDEWYAVKYYAFWLTNFKTAEIPEMHNNKKVVSLRWNTFSDMPFLEKVTLPDSITEIRWQAFKNCVNLSQINIPKKLEYLGWGAFYNAKSIKNVNLPDTLAYLGGEAFSWASSLENIVLPNWLIEIRWDTFVNCISLKSITIPDSVIRIGGHAFSGNKNLSEVIISENSKLEEIWGWAFYNAKSLKTIYLPNSLTSIWWEAFYWASSLDGIVLPNWLTEIRWDSFEYCKALSKINIPDSVTRIGGHAFYGDSNLSEVIISENSKLEEIGSSAFRLCGSLRSIKIPSSTSVNEKAFKESPTQIYRY